MGFWNKLFGKKEENQPADETMANPVATADESVEAPEETADVSEETAE